MNKERAYVQYSTTRIEAIKSMVHYVLFYSTYVRTQYSVLPYHSTPWPVRCSVFLLVGWNIVRSNRVGALYVRSKLTNKTAVLHCVNTNILYVYLKNNLRSTVSAYQKHTKHFLEHEYIVYCALYPFI